MEKTDYAAEVARLEALVRARQAARLQRGVPAFLRDWAPARPEAVFQVCDWLRRLGLYEEGLRHLDLDRPISSTERANTPEGRRRLWIARFFNLIGARDYAVQLAGTLEYADEESCRIAGHIYLAHFDFARAEALLSRAVVHARAEGKGEGYLQRLTRVSWSDALFASGRPEDAFEVLRAVPAAEDEPLLRAILGQAEGEYRARAGQFAEAERSLGAAMALFSSGDRSPDRGVGLKWLGYVRAMRGRRADGRRLLDEAWGILKRPSVSAEAWLDVQRLAGQSGARPAATLARVARYPGLAPGFAALVGAAPAARPRAGAWWIDLASGEFRDPRGRWGLGVPVHLELAAQASLAGAWGVHRARLQSLLWPGQAFSYFSLRNRLDQALFRLRRARVEVRFEEGLLSLRGAGPAVATGAATLPARVRALGEKGRGFGRDEVGALYGLDRTQTMARLNDWLASGWIRAEGQTRARRYFLQ